MCRSKIVVITKEPATFRAFSATKIFQLVPPGPMAQAFTFRAFGAETQSFRTVAIAPDARVVFKYENPLES
jgi:hypothetical protein